VDAPTGADPRPAEVSGRAPPEIKRDGERAPVSRHARAFPARLDEFVRVSAFIAEAALEAGFGHEDGLRLTLVIEELFTNTVTHGPGDGGPVEIGLDVAPGRVAVTYEDSGPPFDPFAGGRAAAVSDPEIRPPGGLGLVLVSRLGRDVRYAHSGGRNHFWLVVEVTP